jgi:cytochrome c oxidase cbb3-type subunit 2
MATAHEKVEKNLLLLGILVVLLIAIGGLVQIVPLFYLKSTTEPVAGLKPYSALQLAGRDVYVREGCYVCHSQMIRPFRAETERYGHYSVAGEVVYPWFEENALDPKGIQPRMRAMRTLGAPYTDEEIANAPGELEGKTEMDAIIAYLQCLGTAIKTRR